MPDVDPWACVVLGAVAVAGLAVIFKPTRRRIVGWLQRNETEIHFSIFGIDIGGKFSANKVERDAAWRLYFETATRISVAALPLGADTREALTSLHKLLTFARETTRDAGYSVAPNRPGETSVGQLAALIIQRLRAFLGKWHPALASHEWAKPADVDPITHRARWARSQDLLRELELLRVELKAFADQLQAIVGCAPLDVETIAELAPDNEHDHENAEANAIA